MKIVDQATTESPADKKLGGRSSCRANADLASLGPTRCPRVALGNGMD